MNEISPAKWPLITGTTGIGLASRAAAGAGRGDGSGLRHRRCGQCGTGGRGCSARTLPIHPRLTDVSVAEQVEAAVAEAVIALWWSGYRDQRGRGASLRHRGFD